MPDGDELLRSLAAFQRCQAAWLADLDQTLSGSDPAFTAAFRRWQEQLAQAKWHLHRSEQRLLHFVLSPQAADLHRDVSVPEEDDHAVARAWRRRLDAWFESIHFDTTYRRLDNCRDLDAEPINADIVTDLCRLAELAELTAPLLDRLADERDLTAIQDLAFYGIISPWRVRGLPPLHDTLRWLAETLSDEEDW